MIEFADDWQRLAACRGPRAELFFPPSAPERKDDKIAREAGAKAICKDCRVRRECLDYAMDIREPHGIWGGLNEAERRVIVESPMAVSSARR
ncbi:MAG: WhiB family transcriptional regulator [Actinomycetes bacterium]